VGPEAYQVVQSLAVNPVAYNVAQSLRGAPGHHNTSAAGHSSWKPKVILWLEERAWHHSQQLALSGETWVLATNCMPQNHPLDGGCWVA